MLGIFAFQVVHCYVKGQDGKRNNTSNLVPFLLSLLNVGRSPGPLEEV